MEYGVGSNCQKCQNIKSVGIKILKYDVEYGVGVWSMNLENGSENANENENEVEVEDEYEL